MMVVCAGFICYLQNEELGNEKHVKSSEIAQTNEVEEESQPNEVKEEPKTIERGDGPVINRSDKNTTLERIEKWQNSGFTQLDYASKDKAIFHSDEGLIVYDMENNKVLRALDLKEIGMNHMQGDTTTVIEIKNDASEILIYNSISYIDEEDRKKSHDNESIYVYNIENDTLKDTNMKSFADEKMVRKDYGEVKTWERKYVFDDKEMSCIGYQYIDENNVCPLLAPMSNTRGVSCLKLLWHKSDTDEEKIYNININ